MMAYKLKVVPAMAGVRFKSKSKMLLNTVYV